MQRMKRIENADVRGVRTQGIVGGCCTIRTCTAWFPPAACARSHRMESAKSSFFLPVPVLRKVFRGKFIAGLKRLRKAANSAARTRSPCLPNPSSLRSSRRLHLRHWVVHAKAPFGGPMQVLRYLGRYTHRVAISNHRLLSFESERVSFQWKDYAHCAHKNS